MPHINTAEVERHLKGITYPANKTELITHAKQQGASPAVVEVLKELHEERFNTPIEVNKAIGEVKQK